MHTHVNRPNSSVDWVLSHWAHFTVLKFILVYVCMYVCMYVCIVLYCTLYYCNIVMWTWWD